MIVAANKRARSLLEQCIVANGIASKAFKTSTTQF